MHFPNPSKRKRSISLSISTQFRCVSNATWQRCPVWHRVRKVTSSQLVQMSAILSQSTQPLQIPIYILRAHQNVNRSFPAGLQVSDPVLLKNSSHSTEAIYMFGDPQNANKVFCMCLLRRFPFPLCSIVIMLLQQDDHSTGRNVPFYRSERTDYEQNVPSERAWGF